MAVILCSRGHYYDENKFFQCPYCGVNIRVQINSNSKSFIESGSKEVGLRDKDKEKTLLLPKEDDGKTMLLSKEDSDKTYLMSKSEDDRTMLMSELDDDKTYLMSESEYEKTHLMLKEEYDKTMLLSSEEYDKTYVISNLKDDRNLLSETVNCPNKSAIAESDKSGMMSSMEIKWLKLFHRRKNDKL